MNKRAIFLFILFFPFFPSLNCVGAEAAFQRRKLEQVLSKWVPVFEGKDAIEYNASLKIKILRESGITDKIIRGELVKEYTDNGIDARKVDELLKPFEFVED